MIDMDWREIIEEEKICLWTDGHNWEAKKAIGFGEWVEAWGSTPLEAVVRCRESIKTQQPKGQA